MGRKANYFRHSLDANQDPKITELIQKGGLKAYGAFFMILEFYGKALINDDEQKTTQKINARLLANAFGLRLDSCRTVVELVTECKLIEAVWLKSQVSSIEVCIPNFLKYFGCYQKTVPIKSPNKIKENKIKENKIKYIKKEFEIEKELPQKPEEIFENILDFLPEDIKQFIFKIRPSVELQKKWCDLYAKQYLIEKLPHAEEWCLSNNKKPSPARISNFLRGFQSDQIRNRELQETEKQNTEADLFIQSLRDEVEKC